MKPAVNEEEYQGTISLRLKESLSTEAEEFGPVIKRDLSSRNDESSYQLTKVSTKPSQDSCYMSPKLLAKSPPQSIAFTQVDSFLIFHKDSVKPHGEETKDMRLRKKNLSFTVNNNQLSQENTEDFLNLSPSTIQGLLEDSEVTKSPLPRTLCLSSTRPNRTSKYSFSFPDEVTFKTQANFVKQLNLLHNNRRNIRASLWQKCETSQLKGYDHYKEVLDKNLEKSKNLDESQFSYHPEISPMSKKKKPKTPHQMTYEAIKKKQEKIKALRKELMDKANKEYTFAPGLIEDPYSKVDSKLKLKDELNTYLKRVKREKAEKERKRRISKGMREIEELAKCTHIPKINKDFRIYRK